MALVKRQPARRKRPDLFDGLVMVLSIALCLGLFWPSPGRTARRQAATAANRTFALRLLEPPIPDGQIVSRSDPRITAWLSGPGLERPLSGRLTPNGKALFVRPWLYTAMWVPQPVAEVRPDGTFATTIFLDGRYESPLALNLEVQDAESKQVIASYTYFVKLPGQPVGN